MDFVWSADAAGMTNPMTTTGDTIYSSSGSTPARLGIGSTGQVLTVASGVPSWATLAAGGMTQLATGSLSGNTTTISSISGSYKELRIALFNYSIDVNNGSFSFWLNGENTGYYIYIGSNSTAGTGVWSGGGVPGSSASNVASGAAGGIGSGSNNNTWIIDFPNYANTDAFKAFTSTYCQLNAAGTGTYIAGSVSGSYLRTTAISSITFKGEGTRNIGGTYIVYGVN
jgi:hypothetical protein